MCAFGFQFYLRRRTNICSPHLMGLGKSGVISRKNVFSNNGYACTCIANNEHYMYTVDGLILLYIRCLKFSFIISFVMFNIKILSLCNSNLSSAVILQSCTMTTYSGHRLASKHPSFLPPGVTVAPVSTARTVRLTLTNVSLTSVRTGPAVKMASTATSVCVAMVTRGGTARLLRSLSRATLKPASVNIMTVRMGPCATNTTLQSTMSVAVPLVSVDCLSLSPW